MSPVLGRFTVASYSSFVTTVSQASQIEKYELLVINVDDVNKYFSRSLCTLESNFEYTSVDFGYTSVDFWKHFSLPFDTVQSTIEYT